MTSHPSSPSPQQGATLVEILVTVIILSFGLLGIAIFQAKAQVGSVESYQRAQAVVLLSDMHARMANVAPDAAPNYVTSNPVGTGGTATGCSSEAVGAARDLCEWGLALRGSAETNGASSSGTNVGAMIGARGCITQVQAANPAVGVCAPGIYTITIAWQGMHPTKAPTQACGLNLYGAENYRRAVSTRVVLGLPTCS